jgi:hypothetical protein
LQPGLPGVQLVRSPLLLLQNCGSKLPSPPASLSWLVPAPRSDLSLARNDFRLPGYHSKVNVPDLLLQSLTEPSSDPFGASLHHSSRFPGLGGFLARNPLPDSDPALPIYPRISTPRPGLLEPFRIDAFNPVPDQEARLPAAPDRPSLPAAFLYCDRCRRRINVPDSLRFRRLARRIWISFRKPEPKPFISEAL